MEAGLLIPRREPPQRLVVSVPESSVLLRRRDPCRHFGDRSGPGSRGGSPSTGCRGALLRSRRECCCPGLRRKYGTSQPIRLRPRRAGPARHRA